jgi:hypothetical protein
MIDPRAVIAARNNADWYTMMFDIHGLEYHRSESAFCAIDSPPPYHSRMTILAPVPGAELLKLIATEAARPGFGIKDSFHRLDLGAFDLTEFFAATWIWATDLPGSDTSGWYHITSAEDLLRWEAAWKEGGSPFDGRQFPDAILGRSDVAIWGRESEDGFDAGAVANLSTDCVGMSNVFGSDAIPAAATLCAEFGSGLPVVGYERGDALVAAVSVGFETVGQLRICGRPE